MRILFITEAQVFGGVDVFNRGLILGLIQKDDSILVDVLINRCHEAVSWYSKWIKDNSNGNVNLQFMETPSYHVFANSFGMFSRIFCKIARFAIEGYMVLCSFYHLRRNRNLYDLVFVSNGGHPGGRACRSYAVAASLLSMKTVYLAHSSPVLSWKYNVFEMLMDMVISTKARLLSVSSYTARSMSKRFLRKKFDYIYNGISPVSVDNKRGKQFTVLCPVGVFNIAKGIEYLLDAAKRLNKLYKGKILIKIVGKGEREPFYRKYIERNRIEIVEIHPFTYNIGLFYREVDVVVLPSIDEESFGLVLIEAMSLGIPVIGANTNGIPEVVGKGEACAGIIVPKKNGKEIAQAIEKLFCDRSFYDAIATKAKQRYEKNFTKDHMISNYYKFLVDYVQKMNNRKG